LNLLLFGIGIQVLTLPRGMAADALRAPQASAVDALVGQHASVIWQYCPSVTYVNESTPVHLQIVPDAAGVDVDPLITATDQRVSISTRRFEDEIQTHILVPPEVDQAAVRWSIASKPPVNSVEPSQPSQKLAPGRPDVATVWFLSPKAAAWRDGAVQWDGSFLRYLGGRVVLLAQRDEALADRRWAVLRRDQQLEVRHRYEFSFDLGPRSLLAALPLLAQDAVTWQGAGLALCLPTRSTYAGWRQREYRQVIAWWLQYCKVLGAGSVVLVPPPLPEQESRRAALYWPVLRDLSRTYDVPLMEVTALQDARYWEVADGVLGPELNSFGQAAFNERLQAWLRSAPEGD
jgi:hypothetical protein